MVSSALFCRRLEICSIQKEEGDVPCWLFTSPLALCSFVSPLPVLLFSCRCCCHCFRILYTRVFSKASIYFCEYHSRIQSVLYCFAHLLGVFCCYGPDSAVWILRKNCPGNFFVVVVLLLPRYLQDFLTLFPGWGPKACANIRVFVEIGDKFVSAVLVFLHPIDTNRSRGSSGGVGFRVGGVRAKGIQGRLFSFAFVRHGRVL